MEGKQRQNENKKKKKEKKKPLVKASSHEQSVSLKIEWGGQKGFQT